MLFTVLALALGTPPTAVTAALAVPDTSVDTLVGNSITDFKTHGGLPADVRSVRLVWHTLADGITRPTICGDALVDKANGKWVPFAALTTSGYEQYVGDGSGLRCKNGEKRFGSRDVTQLYRDRLSKGN